MVRLFLERSPLRWYVCAGAFALLSALVLLAAPVVSVDGFVAIYGRNEWLPGDLRRLVSWSEVFAHGMGVAVIAAAIFALDRARRRELPRVLASAYGAGLLANLGKCLVGRTRPNHFDFSTDVGASFVGFLPSMTAADWGHAMQSFPSGHTATAVGFAVGLSRIFPGASWLFAMCAALAGFQRIASGAHFLSDVLAGAALGFLAGALMSDPRAVGRWFDRLESWWSNGKAGTSVLAIEDAAKRETRRAG